MGVPGAIEDIQPFAELAQNATTLVYKAYQKTLERFVLLKRLRPEFSSDAELARRFQDEARIVARVQHPNVVAIYSYGSDDEGAYIVAEFVEGYDLEELLTRGRIPPQLAVYILLESARGLKAAHDKDVLHRDLKPSNILISHDGEVKLSDFGLASISGSPADVPSEIRGTLAYLAPEQILGSVPDRRSDLFSLGATFYEMLTGRRAFPGSEVSEIFDSILNRDPTPYLPAVAGVDDRLIPIAARLLAREPENRYLDAGELMDDLEAWRVGTAFGRDQLAAFVADPSSFVQPPAKISAATAETASPVARTGKPGTSASIRKRAAVVAGALVFGVALVYAGVSLLNADRDSTLAAGISLRSDTAAFAALSEAREGTATDSSLIVTEPLPASEDEGVDDEDRPAPADTPPEHIAIVPERVEEPPEEVETGRISLWVDPAAEVFIDGKASGRAGADDPLEIELPPGEHDLVLRNTLFPAHEETVRIGEGRTTSLRVSLYEKMGWLELRVSPWAYVYLDGNDLGDRTIETFMLVPGVHRLRLVHPGHQVDFEDEITVARGDTLPREYRIEELK